MIKVSIFLVLLLSSISVLTAQPSNDNCANALSIPVSTSPCIPQGYSNVGWTGSGTTNSCFPSVSNSGDIWFSFTTTEPNLRLKFGAVPAYMLWEIFQTCGGASVQCGGTSGNSSSYVPNLPPGTYLLRLVRNVSNSNAGQGTIFMCLWQHGSPVNDDCANAIPVPVGAFSCSPQSYDVTGWNTSGVSGCGSATRADIWFTITTTQPEFTLVTGAMANGYVQMGFFDACNGNLVNCTYAFENGTQVIQLPPGTYRVRAAGFEEVEGNIEFCIWEDTGCTLSTTVTTTPSYCSGETEGTATALPANGSGPYTYTWYSDVMGPIAGNSAMISGPAGSYTVSVTNPAGCLVIGTATIAEGHPVAFFETQADIDNFPVNNPGMTHYPCPNLFASGSNITNVNGFAQLTSTEGNVFINSNPALTNVNGFSQLSNVGGSLYIEANNLLTNLNGFSQLSALGDYLYITANPALTNISALANLTTIDGPLFILDNTVLTSLTGLDNLISTVGGIDITGNSMISNLNALSGLEAVNGSIYLGSNNLLANINGLSNIDPLTIFFTPPYNGLVIAEQPQLSFCAISPICEYLSVPANTAFINGNATGCATRAQVEAACLLPIELLQFTAKPNGNDILLSWETASERNNAYFEVEHSRNGISFAAIGRVTGSGTTDKLHSYAFTHARQEPGIHYYRLKQADQDGSEANSAVITVQLDDDGIRLFPNPTTGKVFLAGSDTDDVQIKISNNLGQVVQFLPYGKTGRVVDLSGLPDGTYFLEIATGNSISTKSILKQKNKW